jgi:hypothetical protein
MPVKTHGMKINLMVSADCELTSIFRNIEQRIAQNMNVRSQTKSRRGDLIPVIATVIVAVAGTAAILLNDFGPGNASQGSSNARMITSAVSRVGAIEIPSELPAGRRQRGVST